MKHHVLKKLPNGSIKMVHASGRCHIYIGEAAKVMKIVLQYIKKK